MHLACRNKHTKIVDILLDARANSTEEDNNGRTPMFYACKSGSVDIVNTLIKRAAICPVSLPSILSDILCKNDNLGKNFAVVAASAGNKEVLEYMYDCNGIPTTNGALLQSYKAFQKDRNVDIVTIKNEVTSLKNIVEAVNNMVYDSYSTLPEYKRINIIGVEKSANAYLVTASLLATITSIGFLTPPGNFDVGSKKVDEGEVSLIVFILFNGLCFFTSLLTSILTINILAPDNMTKKPVDNAKSSRNILEASALLLMISVIFAAAAYISAALYFISHNDKRAIFTVVIVVVIIGGLMVAVAIILFCVYSVKKLLKTHTRWASGNRCAICTKLTRLAYTSGK